MNEEIKMWANILENTHIPRWEELPDIDLYLEQIIRYMESHIGGLFENHEKSITSAMINNYVKLKLIPKPIKKKYNKTHLAYLITITILKQVLPIAEIRSAIIYQSNIIDRIDAYNLFCSEQEKSIAILLENIKVAEQKKELPIEAITAKMATMAFATNFLARKAIAIEKKDCKE
ncbi:MAG: DUF1836 domain-containing protein [Clostridia bacterium]